SARASAPRTTPNTRPRTAPRGTQPAGAGQAAPGQTQVPRPAAGALRVQVDPQGEAMRKHWALKSGNTRTLTGQFWKFSYDKVFSVEKQAQGEFEYIGPDQGWYSVKGDISPKKKDHPVDAQGREYTVEKDRDERWFCTGKEILVIDDD